MENCRPAIIVSFGVTAHWLPQKGDREAGIVLVAQAFLPVFCSVLQGPGDDDFKFYDGPRGRSASTR
jgi:hypothetical protein